MTNAEKFKEYFGRELEESRMLSMPSSFNQIIALRSFQIVGVDCADEWRNAEYRGTSTKTDLISREEVNNIIEKFFEEAQPYSLSWKWKNELKTKVNELKGCTHEIN